MFPRAVRHGLLIAAAVVWLAPVIVLALVAVRDISDFARYGALALPHTLRWANFTDAWNLGVSTYLFNSLLMTAIKVPTGVLVESLAAFALVFLPLPSRGWLLGFFVTGMIVPIQMTLVPLTVLMKNLGLIDTRFGLFLMYMGFGIPFGILVMRGFFRRIPKDVIEAALIDGCSWLTIYARVIMPLALPAVASLLILDGIATWNEFILAQIFLHSDEVRTLPLGLIHFSSEYAIQYDQIAAAVLIGITPIMLVYMFFQRYFVQGLAGAVK